MKQLSVIFSLFIMSMLQASDLPTDSLHSDQFHRKINFYLKYGTQQETKDVLRALNRMKSTKKENLAGNHCLLMHEESKFFDAENHSKKIVSTLPDLCQAHEDRGTALWNYQQYNNNENFIQEDLAEITRLQQMMKIRKDKLQLRAEKRAFTAEQELLHEQKMQIKRDASILKSRTAQVEKNKSMATQKATFQIERQQQQELKNKDLKILQSLAIQKGIKQTLLPTEAERKAQSQRDKELATEQAREAAENYAMSLAEDASRKAFPRVQIKNPTKHVAPATHTTSKSRSTIKSIDSKKISPILIEHDPLESVSHAFKSLLHILDPKKDDDGNLLFKEINKTRIENAIKKLQKEIDFDKELFDKHKTTSRTSEHLQNVNKLADVYKAIQKENDDKIAQYHLRAKDYPISTNKRFLYYKSQEFERKYKALGNLACTKGKHQEKAKAEFLKLKAELRSCAQDEIIFEEGMHLENVLNAIQQLQTSIDPQVKKNSDDDDYGDGDDPYGFILPACTIM